MIACCCWCSVTRQSEGWGNPSWPQVTLGNCRGYEVGATEWYQSLKIFEYNFCGCVDQRVDTWLRTWLVYKRFSRTWENCDHFPAATWRHENIHSRSWIAVGMYETLQHLWWRPRGSKKTASKCGHVCMFSSYNYTRWWNVWWKVGISYTNTFCLFVLAALPDVAR